MQTDEGTKVENSPSNFKLVNLLSWLSTNTINFNKDLLIKNLKCLIFYKFLKNIHQIEFSTIKLWKLND